ncbi:putative F-box protein At4g17565 [Cornus florida]|uniref:putative F-box protein At4g17565 n=1 Tax=Cornus florida TaxID=4283 RepID=UPI0028993A43|nr:putative F-box protein At4g17565 [Cornus florida]
MIANKTYLGHPTKRRKTASPDWSVLHTDLWESILNRLYVADLLSARAVCHSWCSLAEARISSLETPLFDQPPLLILPSDDDDDQGNKNSSCLYNFTQKKVCRLINIPEYMGHAHYIGSCHGWLIFYDHKEAAPCIFSPFLEVRIQLPLFRGAVVERLKIPYIEKAVVSSHPIHSKNKYWVVVIYGGSSMLGYSKCGDSEWTALKEAEADKPYCDIISYKDYIYALAKTGSIEIWDFNTCNLIPTKKMDIKPSFPRETLEFEKSVPPISSYTSRCYMVESKGDILLIMRYIDKYIPEGILVGDEENPIHLYPYMTKYFHVYKLNFDQTKWVKLESLGDHTLFLGGNHSVLLSKKKTSLFCKRNSIYFTDDYWLRMHGHPICKGHDNGRFDLEDQSIERINEDDLHKIKPAPIWIVPNPWY